MDAPPVPAHPDCSLGSLSNDTLSSICRTVGVEAMMRSMAASTRLHQAWQESVLSLDTRGSDITERDIAMMIKYKNLQRLVLSLCYDVPAHQLAPLEVVGLLAPYLRNLRSITVA